MTQPTPIPEARGELMFDGQALLDRLIAAKLAGTVDRPATDRNVRYRFRDNEQAASVAFDVAEAFFSPLLSALYGDIATLRRERERAFARANEAARLSAEARDHADDLRKQIATLEEHVAIVEDDRTAHDAWTVRVALKHGLPDVNDSYAQIAHYLDEVCAERDRLGDKANDLVRMATEFRAQRDALYLAAKAVVDAGRCAGLGSVGVALVAAVEAVTHPGGET